MAKNKKAGRRAVKPGTAGRLLKYIFSYYKWRMIVVIIGIIISGISGVVASVFLQNLVDTAITPGITKGLDAVWPKLVGIIGVMIGFYLSGVIASLIYTQIMATVTQGTLKHMRDDMFDNMEVLPIRFFDTNLTGDIMSTYTNDTDAIRQMIGQSLPVLFQTGLTIVALVYSMLRFSLWLSIVVFVFMWIMTRATKSLGGASARNMVDQQKTLAAEEGFVQEMMAGQKVVKVFNHEDAAKADFKKYNDDLFEASDKANRAGFRLMPVLGNVGNLMYIAVAIVGGVLIAAGAVNVSLQGVSPLTIGVIVAFLSMVRQMSQQIGQASMQVSMVALGMAGVSRVFELMDQEPEADEGTVELVNMDRDENGRIIEADHNTEMWAWKLPVDTITKEQRAAVNAGSAAASAGAYAAGQPDGEEESAADGLMGASIGGANMTAVAASLNCHDAAAGRLTKAAEAESKDEDDDKIGIEGWAQNSEERDGYIYTPLRGEVTLEHVDFSYVQNKLVLHDVSLFAKPGQKIAFVGATGAGKTTITNLINRFYDIPGGKIRYDGINVSRIKKPALRGSLGVVLQDVNLFTGTVLDNIRYGRLDATDEECKEAARLANAESFILRLPKGYDTMLTDNGSELSQGERQLLSIARAAVADPPVMILDEATSSIDTRTEQLVQAGMDNLMKGRTVFVIAHRLSTVRNSDAIMVLDHGRIIERGSRDALIAKKGVYYQLYTGAFELE